MSCCENSESDGGRRGTRLQCIIMRTRHMGNLRTKRTKTKTNICTQVYLTRIPWTNLKEFVCDTKVKVKMQRVATTTTTGIMRFVRKFLVVFFPSLPAAKCYGQWRR